MTDNKKPQKTWSIAEMGELVNLRVDDGLQFDAIAKRLGRTERSVAVKFHKLMRGLQGKPPYPRKATRKLGKVSTDDLVDELTRRKWVCYPPRKRQAATPQPMRPAAGKADVDALGGVKTL